MADKKGQDITELTERAKVLAEATGRDESDVLADLLDDGVLNNSHKTEDKDLVTQLKEAAALITTVQEINTDISNNKVLNGGDNTTSVKVETTLEGDIVDRAIASAQKKAEDIKTLIATLIPIFLLITGGGMEAFGVIDIIGDDENSPVENDCQYGIDSSTWSWQDNTVNVFGELWTDCLSDSSTPPENMIIMVNAFDPESKDFIEGDIGMFVWTENSEFNVDLRDIDETSLEIWIDLFTQEDFDEGKLPISQMILTDVEKPVAIVWGCMDSNANNFNTEANEDDGSCEYEPEPVYGCMDSEANNYDSGATEDDGSCEYDSEEPCEVEITNHYRGHVADDEEQDAILVAFRVLPTNCEDEDLKIDMHLYQNGYSANYTHFVIIGGEDESQIEYIFDGVAVGNSWIPKITASLDGEILEQVNFWGIDVEQQEDETIYGCMDSEANNYDSEATEDDNSCEYDEPATCEESLNHLESNLYIFDVNSLEVIIEVETTLEGCVIDIEVSISLYQNGLYYTTFDYSLSDSYSIDNSIQEIVIEDDLFSDLEDGTWDALIKIRDADSSEEYYNDIHSNVVVIDT